MHGGRRRAEEDARRGAPPSNPPISVTKKNQFPKARKRVFRLLRGGVQATRVSPNNLAFGAFGRALDLAPRPLIWVDGAPRRSQVAFL